jgi:hypothetical protein
VKPTLYFGVLTLRAGQYSTSVRFFFLFLLFGYRQCEIWHLAPLRRDPIFIFSSLNCAAAKKYLAEAQFSHRQGTEGTSNPKKKVEIHTRHARRSPFFTKFRHLSSIFSSVGLHSPFYKLTASTWKRKMTESFENPLLNASLKLHFHIDIGKSLHLSERRSSYLGAIRCFEEHQFRHDLFMASFQVKINNFSPERFRSVGLYAQLLKQSHGQLEECFTWLSGPLFKVDEEQMSSESRYLQLCKLAAIFF